eukprot:SAG31_NODE_11759_length_1000_cov_3.451720_1_plen_171_part_10
MLLWGTLWTAVLIPYVPIFPILSLPRGIWGDFRRFRGGRFVTPAFWWPVNMRRDHFRLIRRTLTFGKRPLISPWKSHSIIIVALRFFNDSFSTFFFFFFFFFFPYPPLTTRYTPLPCSALQPCLHPAPVVLPPVRGMLPSAIEAEELHLAHERTGAALLPELGEPLLHLAL